MKDPETDDDEVVEHCRRHMQELVDRTDFNAGDVKAVLDSTGVPHRSIEVQLVELRELGSFNLQLPAVRLAQVPAWMRAGLGKHWVYRRESDGVVFVLHLPARVRLLSTGSARVYAFDETKRKD